jgi:hypothetical protein
MVRAKAVSRFSLEVGKRRYTLREAEFRGILYDVVTALVHLKEVDRVSYVLRGGELELGGPGGAELDPLSLSLYRYIEEERCEGPSYEGLGGVTRSFHMGSALYALAALTLFFAAGDLAPHCIMGRPDRDLLMALDRGRRTRILAEDPKLVANLTRLLREGR